MAERLPTFAGFAGLAALALSACAPIVYESAPQAGVGAQPRIQPPPVFDPNGAPEIDASAGFLQCVPFARGLSGIQIFGDANTWWASAAGRYPRSSLPAPGAVLVLEGYRTTARGHVAVVTAMVSAREIRVDHANWMNGGEVTRRVPVLDVSPNNDWTEVRVWHIPSGSWGARIYRAEGFIHPVPVSFSS
ncbi:MAG: CHAP domain-containing protein [Hyphomonadaceae bacterium]